MFDTSDIQATVVRPLPSPYRGEYLLLHGESGGINTLVYLWVFDDAADRERKRAVSFRPACRYRMLNGRGMPLGRAGAWTGFWVMKYAQSARTSSSDSSMK